MQEALFSSSYAIPVILVVYFAVGLSWLLDRMLYSSRAAYRPLLAAR
jgi:hypothetical protein